VDVHTDQRYVLVGGVRSTVLTAGMALADYLDVLLQSVDAVPDSHRLSRRPVLRSAAAENRSMSTAAIRRIERTVEVAVTGAGPAGLAAATRLTGTHRRRVLMLERETTAGAIPRQCGRLGYGIRDLHTVITGTDSARRLLHPACGVGAEILIRSTVTAAEADNNSLEVTRPAGLLRVKANAVVLATGAHERLRSARLIPGDLPTGQLRDIVHRHQRRVGLRAVVVGGQLVSWSAVMTLRADGCVTVLMTTEYRSPESYTAFNVLGKALLRVPVATRSRIVRVIG
jgi:thioredoxin reductase